MRTLRTVAELRETLTVERGVQHSIGLVPTMGALHDGHVSLLHSARAENDVVVMSLFVNPSQFNDGADLAAYPRDEAADAALAAGAGVDILFAPPVAEVYPSGFATTVSIAGLTDTLEGAHRGRGHFDGVATVVTKLLNMVGPDAAYFGQKDAQQALLIRRLVRDLDMPVAVRVCATVREPDGLAMSSRNVHLNADERRRAPALSRALTSAADAVTAGVRDAGAVESAARALLAEAGVETEYFVVADPETLAPVSMIDRPVLALVAARLGSTRLIDNQMIGVADV